MIKQIWQAVVVLIKSQHNSEQRAAAVIATVTPVHHRLEVKIHKTINKTSMEVNRRLRLTRTTPKTSHTHKTYKTPKNIPIVLTLTRPTTTFRVVQFLDRRQFPIKC